MDHACPGSPEHVADLNARMLQWALEPLKKKKAR
jgi:hypothetical protein